MDLRQGHFDMANGSKNLGKKAHANTRIILAKQNFLNIKGVETFFLNSFLDYWLRLYLIIGKY